MFVWETNGFLDHVHYNTSFCNLSNQKKVKIIKNGTLNYFHDDFNTGGIKIRIQSVKENHYYLLKE